VLRDQARKFHLVAESIAEAATQLRAVANSSSATGQFVDEFAVTANDVADRIGKAKKRYTGFATELGAYATPLTRVQQDSVAALNRAIAGHSAVATAKYWEHHYTKELQDPNLSAADIKHYQRLLKNATDDRIDGEREIDRAKSDLDGVVDERNREAVAAAHAIGKVGEDSGINDTGWDNWVQFWEENGEWINNVVTIIGYVAAAFVIIALFVPGLNLIVGGVIGLVMLVSLIAAGLTIINAVCQASAGTKSVNEAVIEVGLALLPFGLGKLGGAGAKATESLLDGAVEAGTKASMASAAAQGIEGMTKPVAAAAIDTALAARATDLAKLQTLANLSLTLDGVGPTVRALLGTEVREIAIKEAFKAGGFALLEEAGRHIELPDPWVLEQQTSW
jgi:hypothetical protein